MINSSYTTGNRIRDLPVCSTVPQATAPPRVPGIKLQISYFSVRLEAGVYKFPARRVILATKFCSWRPVFVVLQY
jgi:hypothetical protein